MAIGRFFGRKAEGSMKVSDYIETRPYDGGKSVNFDKFLKDTTVREQMNRVRKVVADQRTKRVHTR